MRSLSLAALIVMSAAVSAPARASDFSWPGRTGADLPSFDSSLWSIVPLSGARLEGLASLDSRQELKFSTVSTGRYYGLYGLNEFGPGALRLDNTVGLDQPRATYRYTWLSSPDLNLKVGLTSNLLQLGSSMRSGFTAPMQYGSLPQLHLSGVGRLADNWHISVDADGLWTARGRSLDLGLHVGYSLTRSMQLFGGYRMTDYWGDAEDAYGSNAPVNSANVGLRYRF
jgi:hypothetical protein